MYFILKVSFVIFNWLIFVILEGVLNKEVDVIKILRN